MPRAYPGASQANYTLCVLLAACILSFIDRQILNLMIGPIRADFHINDFQISLLQGPAFVVLYAAFGLPLGRLADRTNRKLIIVGGIFYWSAMTVLCGFAGNFSMLFIARMGVGMGEAALAPASYSLLSDTFRPERLARAISIYMIGITAGGGLAYVIGGGVVQLIAGHDSVGVPLLGTLKSWQLAFIVVGLPGLLIGALALWMKEPARDGGVTHASAGTNVPTMREILRFLAQHRRVYVPIYLGIAVLGILGNGWLSWYPTFLARTYGVSVEHAAVQYGLIYGVFGTAGTLGGALLAERLAKAGRTDANMRTVLLVCVSLVPLGICAPLAPTHTAALWLAVPFVTVVNSFYGVAVAALQVITPNRMRAVVSAAFGMTANLVGYGLGATSVGALTSYAFGDDASIRYSLAIVALMVAPLAAVIVWSGLKPYRRMLAPAEAVTNSAMMPAAREG